MPGLRLLVREPQTGVLLDGSVQQPVDGAGADGPAAFPDGEAEPGLERDRLAELDGDTDPVAGCGGALRPEVEHAWCAARLPGAATT